MVSANAPVIETLHLFPLLDKKLLQLLHSLTPGEWQLPTVAKKWTVKDVAAHLLDGNIRMLSIAKDGFMGDPPAAIESYQDLLDYLNRLNADWVKAMKRVSPGLLIELLTTTGQEFCNYQQTLDLQAPAIFSVGWAGEEVSPNWFHMAREYTEKWLHQQQIRDAVNKPGIMTRELFYPFLDTFMMALPHTYRNTAAAAGTVFQCSISGEGGGEWFIIKKENWELSKTNDGLPVTARTTIDGSVAWKLFSKSWRRADVEPFVQMEGDSALGNVVLDMISVMA